MFSTWQISKEFSFCYSHRVFVQKLREEFCSIGDTKCKCRFPHGHQGTVRITVSGSVLNQQSMVCDFKELGFLRDFLDNYIDHKCLVGREDPLFNMLVTSFIEESGQSLEEVPVTLQGITTAAAHVIDVSTLDDSPIKEYLEGIVIIDFVPTSEELARWIFLLAQEKLEKISVLVDRVDWEETPKTMATFRR